MKSSRFILQIEKPCHTNLSAMERNDVGLFCTNCEKHVIDFSKLSDDELIAIVEKTNGNLCGRFTKSQLDRVFVVAKKKQASPRLNKILAGLFAFGMLETAQLDAKETKHAETVWSEIKQQNNTAENDFEKTTISDTTKNVISGVVFSAVTKEPVTNGTITILGTSYVAQIDTAGKFSLSIPDSLITDSISIVINSSGYLAQNIAIKKAALATPQKIALREEIMIEGGMRMVPEPCPTNKKKKRN